VSDRAEAVPTPMASLAGAGATDQAPLEYSVIGLQSLSGAEFDSLFDEMGKVMTAAVAVGDAGGWSLESWESRRDRYRSVDHTYLARCEGELVGFTVVEMAVVDGRRCAHMVAGYIRPEFQGRGIGASFCSRLIWRMLLRKPWSRFYICADIINPIVLAGWRQKCARKRALYPSIEPKYATSHMNRIAGLIAADRYPACPFDVATGVMGNTGPPRDTPTAVSGDVSLDQHYRSHVKPEAAESVLLVIEVDARSLAASAFDLTRSIWRISPRAAHVGRSKMTNS